MKLSILDLAPVVEGATAADALRNAADLARHAEAWGYHRYWLAEHHNMVGIASAATAVCIAHVAAATKTIRVGAGGIMLPNHAPLVIAEQFGTLESLFPGRIDLGLGRAPGTDQPTMRALRRGLENADNFPRDVQEILALFAPAGDNQIVQAVPGAGLNVPVWILGSSTFGAQLAGILGLPYAFASHFAPDYLMYALKAYRERFQPSDYLERPHAMAGVQAIVADTDREARHLFTSMQQAFTNMVRGTRGKMRPPIDDIETYWSPMEKAQAQRMLTYAFVGSPDTVRKGLQGFIAETGVDEVIVAGSVFDHGARLRSYELLAGIAGDLRQAQSAA
ncbi:MAG: LLM class flavin-dependent oxidoreductase [Alphaproteobacteria bacterium]|nr:LLM class flavin-dependent oxidoreductase [Alphaproteobacteria bacterium]